MQLIATDNRKVVVGLGMTGLSCARYLASKQQAFSVVDSRAQPPGLADFQQEFPNIPLSLGEISDESLAGASELVVSPGVSLDQPAISRAIDNGVVVCGDVDLFRQEVSAPVVAITGSNGKSTVTTLVGLMAERSGKAVAVGGNIGVPVLALLSDPEPDLYVLELSSFQLERTADLAAEVATVLNLSADHMDRYANLMDYHRAKHRIFRNCHKAVVNRADPLSRPLVPEHVEIWSFGLNAPDKRGFGVLREDDGDYLAFEFEKLMPVTELKIAGRHNIENALAALALGRASGLPMAPMLDALREFRGLAHRCQYVAESDGVRYFNDSKGTNVGATVAAIEGLGSDTTQVVLIAGGDGKGADFSPLLPAAKHYCRTVVLIGTAATELSELLAGQVPTMFAATMDEAVTAAAAASEPGDVVLLSPACASFDMFRDYMHRGEVFCEAVRRTIGQGGSQ